MASAEVRSAHPAEEIARGRQAHGLISIVWDISGAFGDIGVLFPLAVALSLRNGLDFSAVLLLAGLFYVFSARYFGITMPVQPLKAMSAIAIAAGLGPAVINSAGILLGLVLLLTALTGLSGRLGSLFPPAVIRGIQLGLGLILIRMAAPLVGAQPAIALCTALMLLVAFFLIRRVPPLVPVLLLGLAMAAKSARLDLSASFPVAPVRLGLGDFRDGFILLVLPQIALTFGNAVMATENTAKMLYGPQAWRLNPRSISLSMGLANVLSGFLGGAPMCHGSGGLTAHRKFGAVSRNSGYIIGFFLIVLAVLFGNSARTLVAAFPAGILGVMLAYVGLEHALLARDILGERSAVITAATVAIVGVGANNLTLGFLAGILVHRLAALVRGPGQVKPEWGTDG